MIRKEEQLGETVSQFQSNKGSAGKSQGCLGKQDTAQWYTVKRNILY